MNELDLIAHLTAGLPANQTVVVGAGDDCAVLDLGIVDRFLLFKTDAVIEGSHFLADTEARRVGRKALNRCLSDIAAMGGTPSSAVITLGLPKGYEVAWVEELYAGLKEAALPFSVAIVGGETTTSERQRWVSVAAIGTVAKDKCIRRSGAKAGSAIFVTGELGGSISGRHLDFTPRINEARWLTENFTIESMIDVSDGLAGDLRQILTASNVGAELLKTAIPISAEARRLSRAESSAKPPVLAALTDGEDFELLFTAASKDAVRLLDRWREAFPDVRLSCIGKMIKQPGLHLRDREGSRPFNAPGFVHLE